MKLKAEVQIRKAAEKDAIEARSRVSSLEKKVICTQKGMDELRGMLIELQSSAGLLDTIARVRQTKANDNIMGFDALIKRIDSIRSNVKQYIS